VINRACKVRICRMMSVHDALEAWQAGEITSRRAMALTDAVSVIELYAFASTCGVEIRRELTPAEAAAAEAATQSIQNVMEDILQENSTFMP
jgi:hypothetical protein